MRRWSRTRVLQGVLVVALVVVAANVAGLLRYPGGPLREPNADGPLWLDIRPADQGNNEVSLSSIAGLTPGTPVYVGLYPRNASSWTATVEQVRLINASPGLRLVEARLARPGASGSGLGVASGIGPSLEELRLFSDYQPLPAELAGNAPIGDGRMWLEVLANEPGEYSFESAAIDYRIGPFSFTVVQHQALKFCLVPLAAGVTCSLDPH